MNVLVFFTYGVSLQTWKDSGLIDRELKIYQEMAEKFDVNYTFVTYGSEKDYAYNNLVRNLKILPLYDFKKYHKNKVVRLLQSLTIPFMIGRLLPEKSYIIKTNQLYGGWVAILYKLVSRNPLIVRTGYDLLKFTIKKKKSVIKISLYYLLTFLALNISDFYVSTSNVDIKFLKRYFISKKTKILHNPNWVYLSSEYPILKREEKVLAVGRLEKQKDFSYLLDAFEDLDISLDLFGEGSEKTEIIERIKKKKNISLKEPISNKNLIEKYSEYPFYISTSDFEGNSKTLMEAMGAGCVVIVPNIKNNLEIVKHNQTGILYDKHSDDLKKIINSVSENKELLKKISRNARAQILKNNSLSKVVEFEIDIYNQILEKS